MGLEFWDHDRRRFVLYMSRQEHSDDCIRHPFEAIPSRIFLDTNVINLLVKESVYIFEQEGIGQDRFGFIGLQAEALMHLFAVGCRADWTLVGSVKSLEEIGETCNDALREMLLDYALEIVETRTERAAYAADFGRRLAASSVMRRLPDLADPAINGFLGKVGSPAVVFVHRNLREVERRVVPRPRR